MKDIKVFVPELPESISNAVILKWYKKTGDTIREEELIAEIETDKIILEVCSPVSGVIKSIFYKTGESVKSQDILASIEKKLSQRKPENIVSNDIDTILSRNKNYTRKKNNEKIKDFSPKIRRMILNNTIDIKKITNNQIENQVFINNIIQNDATFFLKKEEKKYIDKDNQLKKYEKNIRSITRIPMNALRKKISERLLFTTRNTAMLTTFNEIKMQEVIRIKNKYQDIFLKKYEIRLGYMSFFIKAITKALEKFPEINASIENDEIIYHNYYDINVAISTQRGLIAPILLDANLMKMFEIEKKIKYFSNLGKTGKISLNDLKSGTFTVTNGGVFGSLMSTPMINPPQAAILGMHSINERPVFDGKKIKVMPMMYVALSYDHRLIDGEKAIKFLSYIKDILEDISYIMLDI